MSRLPGGIFVGVVTLLCGLVFAQYERGKRDQTHSAELIPANSEYDEFVPANRQQVSPQEKTQVAIEERTKS
ncbi:MAG: hypothetical protein JWM11_3648 [Planctomycetaceae bacterium]|nr:hypothetical protein [Planctomycetaceae bacterium]